MKAKARLENDLKEVKRHLKKEKKNYLSQLYLDNPIANDEEVSNTLQQISYDFPNQTLTISSLNTDHISSVLNLAMGQNKFSFLSDNNISNEDPNEKQKEEQAEEDIKKKNNFKALTKNSLSEIKKKQFRCLTKSKAYKKFEKMKQKKKLKKNRIKKKVKSRFKKNKIKYRKKYEK